MVNTGIVFTVQMQTLKFQLQISSSWSRTKRLSWFLAYRCVERRPTWITGKLSEMLCLPTMSFIYKCQASSLASVPPPWEGWRRTAPHLHLSGRGGADDSQERKWWDSVRGQLPLTAPEPQNNQLVCGSERPQVANRTCFPLLKCLIEQLWGGGDHISLSQVQSAVFQTVGGESRIEKAAFECVTGRRGAYWSSPHKKMSSCRVCVCAWQAALHRQLLLFPTSVFEIERRPVWARGVASEYRVLLSNWLSKG